MVNKTRRAAGCSRSGSTSWPLRSPGIRVGAVRLAVYGISGLLTGIASVIYSSRVFSVRGDAGTGLELLAIAAVVVGGASIRGGQISVARTTLAVIVIGVIPDGLQLADIDTSWQYVTIGVVMVAAIVINELLASRASARRAGRRGEELKWRTHGQTQPGSRDVVEEPPCGVALLLPELAACCTGTGGSSASASSKNSKVIVLIPKQTSDPFFTNAEKGAKQAAAQLGYTIDYVGPITADASGQVTTIENAIRQKPAAITISGDDPNAVAPALEQAMKAGIVVSSYNADVAPAARQFFVSQASDEGIAEAIVDTMAAQTHDKGHFLLVTSTSTAANQNTWLAYMRKYIPTKYPQMNIDQVIPGNDDPATVLSVTSSYLSAHKSTTTGVWVIGGGMSGAIKAEQQQGINPHTIPIAGLCIPSDVKVDVNSGLIKNCLLWSPADTAYADVYAINAAMQGQAARERHAQGWPARHAHGHRSRASTWAIHSSSPRPTSASTTSDPRSPAGPARPRHSGRRAGLGGRPTGQPAAPPLGNWRSTIGTADRGHASAEDPGR